MIVSVGQQYQIPSEGSIQGVLAEVVDQGLIEVEWAGETKIQHKCLLTFEIDEWKDGTEDRLIVSRQFTASLDERGNLRKFLQGWRGRSFTDEELKAFDLDTLVGVNAILSLVHNTKNGKTYCNIASASRLLKGMDKMEVSAAYVPYAERMARRNERVQAASASANEPPEHGTFDPGMPPDDDGDNDIPF